MAASPNLWLQALEKLSQEDLKHLGFKQPLGQQPLGQVESTSELLLQSLVAEVEKQQILYDQKRTTFMFRGKRILLRDVADKVIRWIHKFGDIAVASSRMSPPWAVIRFVLLALVANEDERSHLLVAIEIITKSIVYCTIYEKSCCNIVSHNETDDTHVEQFVESFRGSIEQHYSTVLELLLIFAKRGSQGTARRAISAISHPDRVPSLTTKLENEAAKLSDVYQKTIAIERRIADHNFTLQLEALKEPLRRSMRVQQDTFKLLDRETFFSLLDWCSDPQHTSYHGSIKSNRAENTGGWLRAHPSFTRWQDSSSSSLLLLHGQPGFGKTVLVSSLVDWSEKRCREARTSSSQGATGETFAFFYCSRSEAARRSPTHIFRAFVRQTAAALYKDNAAFGVHSKLEATWVDCRLSSQSLDIATCRALLLDAIASRPLTTLYLDALDECEKKERASILTELNALVDGASRPLKILVSSRPNPDVLQAFQNHEQLEIEVSSNTNDMSIYIDQQMSSFWPQNIRSKQREAIKNRLLEKGMFQFVALQMTRLSELEVWTQNDLEKTIESMPADLKALYKQMFDSCTSRITAERFAKRALSWVMIADRPLGREWLLTMVRIDPDTEVLFEEPEGLDESTLVSICEGFLVLDKEREVWRFCHLSAQEYLEDLPKDTLGAEELVAKVTLKFLLIKFKQYLPLLGLDTLFESDSTRHVARSVSHSWPALIHPKKSDAVSPLLQNRLGQFFELSRDVQLGMPGDKAEAPYLAWSKDYLDPDHLPDPKSRFHSMRAYARYIRYRGPLDIIAGVCIFGCRSLLSWCLEGEHRDAYWSLIENSIPSSLAIAAFFGHEEVCLDILRYDLTLSTRTTKRQLSVGKNASRELSLASEMGMVRVIEVLISRGADPNKLEKRPTRLNQGHSWLQSYITFKTHAPLIDAATHDSEHSARTSYTMVEKLLEARADMDVSLEDAVSHFKLEEDEVPFKINALSLSILKGARDVVELLKSRGAKLPTPMEARTIGHLLARTRGLPHEMLFHVPNYKLSQRELDYCLVRQCGVSEWGATAQTLVAKGANIYGNPGRESPLVSLINNCRDESTVLSIIDSLINFGLDVNMVVPEDVGTALGAAARNTSLLIVNHLLQRGATPNVTGGILSPLAAISHKASTKCQQVLERLLEEGANPKYIPDQPKVPTALEAALSGSRYCECATLLLDAGANPFLKLIQDKTPLHLAIESGASVLVQKLLDLGADPSQISGKVKQTPLQIAITHKCPEMIQMLLNAGANVNAISIGRQGTALQMAITENDPEMVQILLNAGADVNAISIGRQGTPLQIAITHKSPEIVQMLLNAGADVEKTPQGTLGTPLQIAVQLATPCVVQVLLDAGADIRKTCAQDLRTRLHITLQWIAIAAVDMLSMDMLLEDMLSEATISKVMSRLTDISYMHEAALLVEASLAPDLPLLLSILRYGASTRMSWIHSSITHLLRSQDLSGWMQFREVQVKLVENCARVDTWFPRALNNGGDSGKLYVNDLVPGTVLDSRNSALDRYPTNIGRVMLLLKAEVLRRLTRKSVLFRSAKCIANCPGDCQSQCCRIHTMTVRDESNIAYLSSLSKKPSRSVTAVYFDLEKRLHRLKLANAPPTSKFRIRLLYK